MIWPSKLSPSQDKIDNSPRSAADSCLTMATYATNPGWRRAPSCQFVREASLFHLIQDDHNASDHRLMCS
jgi:hypothetical protein